MDSPKTPIGCCKFSGGKSKMLQDMPLKTMMQGKKYPKDIKKKKYELDLQV